MLQTSMLLLHSPLLWIQKWCFFKPQNHTRVGRTWWRPSPFHISQKCKVSCSLMSHKDGILIRGLTTKEKLPHKGVVWEKLHIHKSYNVMTSINCIIVYNFLSFSLLLEHFIIKGGQRLGPNLPPLKMLAPVLSNSLFHYSLRDGCLPLSSPAWSTLVF